MLSSAFTAVNSLLSPLGVRVARRDAPAARRRKLLLEREQIGRVLDVGANTGQYGRLLRALGYRGRIVSFEPLPSAFAELSRHAAADPAWHVRAAAVGEVPGRLPLSIAGNSVSSSLLPMAEAHKRAAPGSAPVGTMDVDVLPLAPVITETAERTYLKIDTQGYELAALKGAGSALRSVRLVEVELSLTELYHGQPLFRDVDLFLVHAGFTLASIEEGFWDAESGRLLQMDGIYLNTAAA